MKRTLRLLIGILLLLSSVSQNGYAQEDTKPLFTPKVRGAVMMANTHIPKGFEGTFSGITVPTWGFDVDYFFHPHWSVALQGDIKLASFDVEEENIILVRSYPACLVPVIHFHALRHWSFYTGIGIELESHENLYLLRLGSEYSFEITEKFEIALNLMYENKQEVYDTWTFGIAFNTRLWQKK